MARLGTSRKASSGEKLSVVGLFAGIGGIEEGLHQAGHSTALLCEIEPGAAGVLRHHFPDADLAHDVRKLKALPDVDVVAAGFPCQDLSQAGRTAGIRGKNSGLVGQVFRLLDSRRRAPRWLLFENVSFMLQLDRGKAMRYLVDALEDRGYAWAYRVVDTRAFGLPQRRQRVIMVASKTDDPRPVLLAEDAGEPEVRSTARTWYGFYWTEGNRGLGWAVDAVPTLKGGSSVGIPSPPAIWNPSARVIVTPDIRDAERLQGFDADWTLPALAVDGIRAAHRWKLVGNAVSVPVARWVGENLARPRAFQQPAAPLLPRGVSWPRAAWGHSGKVYAANMSMWPVRWERPHLAEYLRFPLTHLSERAASGFHGRAVRSSLFFVDGFLEDVDYHAKRMAKAAVA